MRDMSLLILFLVITAGSCDSHCYGEHGKWILGSWKFVRYTEFGEEYAPSSNHVAEVTERKGPNFLFEYSYELCTGKHEHQNGIAIQSTTAIKNFEWFTLGQDGLPEKSHCRFGDLTFSKSGRVVRSKSNCYFKEACGVRIGAPNNGLEKELNELCPKNRFKTFNDDICGDKSSEEDDKN